MESWLSQLLTCPESASIPSCQFLGIELSTLATLASVSGIGIITVIVFMIKRFREIINSTISFTCKHIGWRLLGRPLYSNVPNAVRAVRGRSNELSEVRELFSSATPSGKTLNAAAICSLGGMGKTTVAEEYARQYGHHYHGIWIIPSSSKSTLMGGILSLGREISTSISASDGLSEAARRTFRSLPHSHRWLLVFDDVENPKHIEPCLRFIDGSHVLITSRYKDWKNLASSYEIGVLGDDAAVDLLIEEAGFRDDHSVHLATEVLGGLPLALVVAGGFLRQTGLASRDYIEQLGKRLEDAPFNDRYQNSIFGVVAQSSRSLSPSAFNLLKLIAFLPHDKISVAAICQAFESEVDNAVWAEFSGETLAVVDLLRDQAGLMKAFSELNMFSLISTKTPLPRWWSGISGRTDDSNFHIHQLTQAVVVEILNVRERTELADVAALIASGLQPRVRGIQFRADTWDQYEQLAPHALNLDRLSPYLSDDRMRAASKVCNDAGVFFRFVVADLEKARELFERGYRLAKHVYGPNHQFTTAALSNLAEVKGELGADREAEAAFLEVIATRRESLGENHKSIAFSHNNFGEFLHKRDRYPEAIAQFTKAVEVRELNQMHTDRLTIMSKANLALSIASNASENNDQAALEHAFEVAREVLLAVQDLSEPNRLAEAVCLERHGRIASLLGDTETAIASQKEALAIMITHYGPNHPDVWKGRELLASHFELSGLEPSSAFGRSTDFVSQICSQLPRSKHRII